MSKGKKEDEKVFNMRIPAETHYKIKVQAAIEGTTIKELLIKMIDMYCAGKKME